MQSAPAGTQMGMLQCMRLTWRQEGVRGYYKGMQSPLAGEGFFNAAQFFFYGHSRRMLLERANANLPAGVAQRTDLTVGEYFLAGGLTGFFSSFVENPIDLFKCQLQTQYVRPVPLFTTFAQCISYVMRVNGVRGAFQGLSATFLRTTPASACYFGVYEASKRAMLAPGQSKDDLAPHKLLMAGGLAGVAYWLSCFPADSIKSAMQADEINPAQRRFRGIMDCARQLYAEGGVPRFFNGLAPCLLRSFPANAACFFAYERALSMLQRIS